MYVSSVLMLILFSWLAIHIPKSSVPHALILFYVYLIDFLLNVLFTVLFALSWFSKLVQSDSSSTEESADSDPSPSLLYLFFQAESIPSLLLLIFFASLKFYFVLITLSYSNKLIVDSGIRPQNLPPNFSGRVTRLLMKPYIMAANRSYLRNHTKRFTDSIELEQRLMDEVV